EINKIISKIDKKLSVELDENYARELLGDIDALKEVKIGLEGLKVEIKKLEESEKNLMVPQSGLRRSNSSTSIAELSEQTMKAAEKYVGLGKGAFPVVGDIAGAGLATLHGVIAVGTKLGEDAMNDGKELAEKGIDVGADLLKGAGSGLVDLTKESMGFGKDAMHVGEKVTVKVIEQGADITKQLVKNFDVLDASKNITDSLTRGIGGEVQAKADSEARIAEANAKAEIAKAQAQAEIAKAQVEAEDYEKLVREKGYKTQQEFEAAVEHIKAEYRGLVDPKTYRDGLGGKTLEQVQTDLNKITELEKRPTLGQLSELTEKNTQLQQQVSDLQQQLENKPELPSPRADTESKAKKIIQTELDKFSNIKIEEIGDEEFLSLLNKFKTMKNWILTGNDEESEAAINKQSELKKITSELSLENLLKNTDLTMVEYIDYEITLKKKTSKKELDKFGYKVVEDIYKQRPKHKYIIDLINEGKEAIKHKNVDLANEVLDDLKFLEKKEKQVFFSKIVEINRLKKEMRPLIQSQQAQIVQTDQQVEKVTNNFEVSCPSRQGSGLGTVAIFSGVLLMVRVGFYCLIKPKKVSLEKKLM
ncbi:7325_t:CDS:2, partial [Ambispora leptoticha]